ncbi:MAG: serine hydrolase [Clostridia bacterium]|nr:serine hydrolase [Clostridia bacterium]
MNYCTPEKAGIPSEKVLEFFTRLDAKKLSTHSVVMARGNSIFAEGYYKPFDKDFKHRMYSVSKTFVSVAIGFCEQDGLISLDDKLIKYFPEYVSDNSAHKMSYVTIREMLNMTTALEFEGSWWFGTGTKDRVECYFRANGDKYPGTLFCYDSPGSFMLGVIVEKVTGKKFLKYLQEKVLDDIGFSKDAYCLEAPGGHSFGDSGVMCTTKDLLLFARFVLNKGVWNGKRYLNEKYLTDATTMSVANNIDVYGFELFNGHGYGYQIWGMPHGCFAMLGMGGQIAFCDPKHDFVFAINSDNQGNTLEYEPIFEALYGSIIANLGDSSLPENEKAYKKLTDELAEKELFFLGGEKDSEFASKIDRKTFTCDTNRMGFKWFRFEFGENFGTLHYENAQGVKAIKFGFGRNEIQKFPQENYSDMIATYPEPGHKYECACSADWQSERQIRIRVQIIDKYFGNLAMIFAFKDADHVTARFHKVAEAFLDEYNGIMTARSV